MAINKVGSKGIEDGSIAAADFADETLSSDKFTNATIENAKLSNSSITAAGSSISLGGSVTLNNQFVIFFVQGCKYCHNHLLFSWQIFELQNCDRI